MRAVRGLAWIGTGLVFLVLAACVLSLPYTLGRVDAETRGPAVRRYEARDLDRGLLPPFWSAHAPDEATRRTETDARPLLGTDRVGRDLFVRLLAGGGVSLGIGLAGALVAVLLGTLYGATAGLHGGRIDAAMMRGIDILYGLPNILLVVLLAVAVDGWLAARGHDLAPSTRQVVNVATLLVAIGGVSWLTMARVIRGQVLSLKGQPFMEACRVIGVPARRQFTHHLLPNLVGPILVYATLTVPAAILAESFLSFLGIGVREPLPSWGNLAAGGLSELNVVRSRWWLLLWPCLLIGSTLLALNFLGEALRERIDPKRQPV